MLPREQSHCHAMHAMMDRARVPGPHGCPASSSTRQPTPAPPTAPHLLRHHLAGASRLQLAPFGRHRADHALLLQVLIAAVLAQLREREEGAAREHGPAAAAGGGGGLLLSSTSQRRACALTCTMLSSRLRRASSRSMPASVGATRQGRSGRQHWAGGSIARVHRAAYQGREGATRLHQPRRRHSEPRSAPLTLLDGPAGRAALAVSAHAHRGQWLDAEAAAASEVPTTAGGSLGASDGLQTRRRRSGEEAKLGRRRRIDACSIVLRCAVARGRRRRLSAAVRPAHAAAQGSLPGLSHVVVGCAR